MSRARILADYVSSGDELALKAPIAGPTFTGTVAIPNVANLETAVVANTAKVTNYNQTLADINALDVTELGTVTSGTFQGALNASTTGGGLMAKGTVTESGGTPTGAIFERGSNGNGEYTKYADGALICNNEDIQSNSDNSITWTFPHAFATGYTPACVGTGSENPDRIDVGGGSDPISNTSWNFVCYYLTSGSSGRSSSKQSMSAIGRWY